MHLGVRAVIAKSIERIHMANLANFGIVPLMFRNNEDFEKIQSNDEFEIPNFKNVLQQSEFEVLNKTQKDRFSVFHSLTPRQTEILLSGGLINYYLKRNRRVS